MLKALLLLLLLCARPSHGFALSSVQVHAIGGRSLPISSAVPLARTQAAQRNRGGVTMVAARDLHEPETRVARYGDNMAQYLLDLHESCAVFDFCGGMMFQLVLTDKLRQHLQTVAFSGDGQPVVCDEAAARMSDMAGYEKSAFADNRRLFHGREIRAVPTAGGGMGFVLQLSYAGTPEDPEGWTGT